ncbi:pentapeptide repeat-containing protein [Streptomyces sp. NPDC005727]|uniref:pentapeptide repeat-containing protein n=1 Tax=Streptomyces sp. NPDC005727 TaxID=3157053 RepID=UPI00340DF9EF
MRRIMSGAAGMTPPSPPNPSPPSRRRCGHGADPVGCHGIHVPGHTACLAHLGDADRDAYLAGLIPGADIDHSGTPFTEPLLDAVLDALRDPATGHPRLGVARFEAATFQGYAGFDSATFEGAAGFELAAFQDDAGFRSATFQGYAWFQSATFEHDARFEQAVFEHDAWFEQAVFERSVSLGPLVCAGRVKLSGTRGYSKTAWEKSTVA